MEGLSGHAAAQRSVIGEHRSESEARAAAALERGRLEVIYGEGAAAWRIVVIRDGEVVAEEHPAATPSEREPRPPPSRHGEPPDEAPTVTPREEWPDMDMSGPVPEWVISRVEESIARRRERDRPPVDEAADETAEDAPQP